MEVNVKKKILLVTLIIMSLVLIGCTKKTSSEISKESGHNQEQDGGEDNNESEDEKIYKQLFDLNNKISIEIKISDKELEKIQQDYSDYDAIRSKSPIYRMAEKVTITVGDEVYEIEEVGIRLKGNTSRKPIYDSETKEPNITHYRLSFDETFDDETYYGKDAKVWANDEERSERKKRTFATLKGLELKWNSNFDNTYVRENYSYSMFRENGVLAPQNTLSSIILNGDNYGVYKIYEPVDKIFIERNLEEKDWGGDLYKCAWTFSPASYTMKSTYGVEDADGSKFYNYDLKTNKSTSQHESIKNLLTVLNNNQLTKEEYEKVLDTDYIAKFFAISYFTGNPDDMRNNYNNHYVYFLKSSGKAIFIPYDYDRCFGITYSWNPEGTGMTQPSPFSDRAEGLGRNQQNPIIKNGILGDGYILDKFKAELSELAESKWLKIDNFTKLYELAKNNYEDVTKPSVEFFEVDNNMFYFGLDGKITSEDDANMSVEDYFSKILETYKENTK